MRNLSPPNPSAGTHTHRTNAGARTPRLSAPLPFRQSGACARRGPRAKPELRASEEATA